MNEKYNINELMNLGKNGDTDTLLSKLSKEDANKVKEVLNNKELTEKILNSKEAKELIKNFLKGGKNNG